MAIRVTPQRFRGVAIVTLVMLALIIVAGAAVRLTGSGLGCEDWPRCSQTRLIDVSDPHTAVEQVNRLFSALVGVVVVVCAAAARIRTPPRRDLSVLTVILTVGTLANAVIGGISVRVDLHPLAVQAHMLLAMGLIVAGTMLVRRAGEPDGAARHVVTSETAVWLTRAHFAATLVAVATGTLVTAAGPHAGDENAQRLDVAIPTVARVHGGSVIVAVVLAIALAARLRHDPADRATLARPLEAWIFVALLQAAVGYIQYFNDVPALLVGIHVAGATAVMWMTTVVLLATRRAAAHPYAASRTESVVAGMAALR